VLTAINQVSLQVLHDCRQLVS